MDMNPAGNLCTCGVCRLSNTAGIFDVDTLVILLRLAFCSRVRTFSDVREVFRVCTLMGMRSHRYTHGRSRDHLTRSNIFV